MGAPDQLAKRVFAEEIPSLFGVRVVFHPGLDLGFAELRLDGILTFDRSVGSRASARAATGSRQAGPRLSG